MIDPKADPSSIGNLLSTFGVTGSDIARGLKHMLASDQKLGETLVELQIITQGELAFALARQEVMRAESRKGRSSRERRDTIDATCRIIDYATFKTKQSNEALDVLTSHVHYAAIGGKS